MQTLIQITKSETAPKFALFELGFRPFFLLGSVWAMFAIIPWVLFLHGITFNPIGGGLWWHIHEMIFGFALAIIMGFLLTAGQNWTNVPSAKGVVLAGLTALWLFPRIILIAAPQSWWVMAIVFDAAAGIGVAVVLARMMIQVKQWRNLPFALLVGLFSLLNIASYISMAQKRWDLALNIHHAALLWVAVVMNMMGGRVIAFFTERASTFTRTAEPKWLLSFSNAALIALALAFLFEQTILMRVFAGISAVLLAYRFNFWGWQHSHKNPLLWSLHLSFVCLPLMCALLALGFPRSGALHLFTIGAMSGLIVSMMSRVSLGHTGRMLAAQRGVRVAYGLIAFSALLRATASIWAGAYLYLIDCALLAWILAWAIFLWRYALMYIQPRIDGRRG